MATEECDVRVSLCPIRLNVDQDALFFLRDFVREVTGDTAGESFFGERDEGADSWVELGREHCERVLG